MARQRKRTAETKFRPPRLEFDVWEYNPQGLRKYDEKALRKEYRRLRDIAQKRLKRMAGTMFEESETYRQNVGSFAETRNIKSAADLRRGLTDLARFVMAEGSTVSGQKSIMARGLQTWREKGPEYAFLNESNWFSWVRFLEYTKSHEQYLYDLQEMAAVFDDAVDPAEYSIESLYDAYVERVESYS